jgi:hypothetical protein
MPKNSIHIVDASFSWLNKSAHCCCSLQGLPVSVAFANLLYGAAVYKPAIPALSRLIIGSNAIQQLVATPLSRLHFLVCQVQDIGLIFLNAMTKDIAARLADETVEKIVGTAILTSCIATIAVGITQIQVGRCCPCLTLFPACLHCKQRYSTD